MECSHGIFCEYGFFTGQPCALRRITYKNNGIMEDEQTNEAGATPAPPNLQSW